MFQKFVSAVAFGIGIALIVLMVGHMMGCQIDVSGSVGAKAFYPDKIGNSTIGDPRKPMYEGSGYIERHTAGGQSDYKGSERFEGLKEAK